MLMTLLGKDSFGRVSCKEIDHGNPMIIVRRREDASTIKLAMRLRQVEPLNEKNCLIFAARLLETGNGN